MKFTEAQLATHFINTYLSDFDVYKEVPCAGIVDIFAVKRNIYTSFEAKTSFSFDVIEQAVKNKSYSHYSYVLIPHTKKKSFAYEICREYGIGIITVFCMNDGRMGNPIEYLKPRLNRNIRKPKLADWMKLNIAGVQSGRITTFSNTVSEITAFLKRQRNQRAIVKDVFTGVSHHYGSLTSATTCIMNMCRKGVIKDFYFEKGYMILTAHP